MCVYLRTKFQASTVILTSFRQGGVILLPPQNEPLKSSSRLGLKRICYVPKILFENQFEQNLIQTSSA